MRSNDLNLYLIRDRFIITNCTTAVPGPIQGQFGINDSIFDIRIQAPLMEYDFSMWNPNPFSRTIDSFNQYCLLFLPLYFIYLAAQWFTRMSRRYLSGVTHPRSTLIKASLATLIGLLGSILSRGIPSAGKLSTILSNDSYSIDSNVVDYFGLNLWRESFRLLRIHYSISETDSITVLQKLTMILSSRKVLPHPSRKRRLLHAPTSSSTAAAVALATSPRFLPAMNEASLSLCPSTL